MAFWSKKPNTEAKATEAQAPAKKAKAVSANASAVAVSASEAIIRPHVTEKAGIQAQNNVYTFIVSNTADKTAIAKAVNAAYKVKPVKVAVINLPAKKIFVRGRVGSVPGTRKAMVTLKKGDKIDFV